MLPDGAPGIATLVILVIIGVFLLISMIIAGVNTAKVDRTFKIGKRLGELCGNEYLELETAQHNLQSKFGKTKPIGKTFLVTLYFARFIMLMALLLLLVVLWMFFRIDVSDGNASKMPQRALAVTIFAWFLASVIMWIMVWIKDLKKYENNVFYQEDKANADADYDKYKKNTLRFGIPIISITFLIGAAALALNMFLGPSKPEDTKYYTALKWYRDAGVLLIFTSILWTFLFVIYRWYAKGFFEIAKTINGDYYGALITGDDKLKSLVNDLYTGYMKSTTKPGGVLENVQHRVHAMLVKHFATNIRSYDKSNQGDDISVITRVADKGELWKYMMHRQGQELEEVHAYVVNKLGRVTNNNAIETWRENFLTLIRDIRNKMREIRGNTTFQTNVRKFVRRMIFLLFVVIGVLMFLVFHSQYQENPGRTVMNWCIGIILITILMTAYGWVNTAIRL